MALPQSEFRLLRFWSEDHEPHLRLSDWSEVLSRMLLKAEVEPLTPTPVQVDASLRLLPGVRFGAGQLSAMVIQRTRAIAAADREGFFIVINTEGPLTMRVAGRDVALEEGDGCFLRCSDEMSFVRHTTGRHACARVDGARLRALVPDADELSGLVLRRGNEALRMLTTYLRDLDDNQGLTSADLRAAVVSHIFGLLVLALHAARAEIAGGLSPGEAKRRAIKRYVVDNLAEQELSVAQVASANALSARQVQRLFEAEDTTFSEFLLVKRLENVHTVLTDNRQAHLSISSIALAAGFGDVSYFNRTFRDYYGASPTAIRQAAADRRNLPPMA